MRLAISACICCVSSWLDRMICEVFVDLDSASLSAAAFPSFWFQAPNAMLAPSLLLTIAWISVLNSAHPAGLCPGGAGLIFTMSCILRSSKSLMTSSGGGQLSLLSSSEEFSRRAGITCATGARALDCGAHTTVNLIWATDASAPEAIEPHTSSTDAPGLTRPRCVYIMRL